MAGQSSPTCTVLARRPHTVAVSLEGRYRALGIDDTQLVVAQPHLPMYQKELKEMDAHAGNRGKGLKWHTACHWMWWDWNLAVRWTQTTICSLRAAA